MNHFQPGIAAPLPGVGRYLFFSIHQPQSLRESLARLAAQIDGEHAVLGLGPAVFEVLGLQLPGLHDFPAMSGHGVEVPSTQGAAWCWLRGSDTGHLLRQTRLLEKAAAPALHLERVIDAFKHDSGRDLTGYEDGTENPKGEDAEAAAFVHGQGAGLDGSSYVAVQQWLHDFDAFEAMSSAEQDNSIGRRRSDNEELADAPVSAHVKRTAQESFEPEAFVLRRMAGQEDGIIDALFRFSRPVTGAYFWCPPMREGRIDLARAGL